MLRRLRDRIADYLAETAQGRPFELPLICLHTVLFPGGVLPLRLFEPRYVDMAKRCLSDQTPFGVCLMREGEEVGAPALPHRVGTTASIIDWDMRDSLVLTLRTLGGPRFQILESHAQEDGLLRASVRLLPLEPPQALPAEHAACAAVLRRIIETVGEARFEPPLRYEDTVWVGYRLAEVLPLKLGAKQNMLEMNDSLMRIEILHRFLSQQGLST
jgi:Lon protease-like protein